MHQKENGTSRLCFFIRYGFFILLASVLFGLKIAQATRTITILALGGMLFLYGLYFLLGLQFKFKHLYSAMQAVYHEKIAYDKGCLDKDIRITGYFFTIIGMIGTIAFYFRL